MKFVVERLFEHCIPAKKKIKIKNGILEEKEKKKKTRDNSMKGILSQIRLEAKVVPNSLTKCYINLDSYIN